MKKDAGKKLRLERVALILLNKLRIFLQETFYILHLMIVFPFFSNIEQLELGLLKRQRCTSKMDWDSGSGKEGGKKTRN
jgi:hypothetical protein